MEKIVPSGKKTLGRRKIQMKKIEKKTSLQVTFSKRRKSLFLNAAGLSVSFGADIAILVQSPGGNFFTFGNPSVDSVLRRFETGVRISPEFGQSESAAEESRRQFAEAEMRLQWEEKRIKSEIDMEKSLRSELMWWEELEGLEGMELEELEELLQALEGLRDNAIRRADNIVLNSVGDSSTSIANPLDYNLEEGSLIEGYDFGGFKEEVDQFNDFDSFFLDFDSSFQLPLPELMMGD